MVIDTVHGLQATGMSLNDRFTILAKVVPERIPRQPQQRRRNSMGAFAQNLNFNNRLIVEQVARRLEMQAKRAIKQRLGTPQSGLRRFGSESNIPRMLRSNSYNNLNQRSVKDRIFWRNSNGNLSRSASFSNLTNAAWRGFRRRGGGRQLRGRFRGRGVGRPRGARNGTRAQRTQTPRRVRGGARGRGRGRGRGGMTRNQNNQQKLVTKEELDRQLDQYMAGTKVALDLELDNYMKNAMDLE